MTWITFTQDVMPDGDENAEPLYKKGYCCDVSEKEAHRCVRMGIARRGAVLKEPALPVEANPGEIKTLEEQPFRPGRSSKPVARRPTETKSDD